MNDNILELKQLKKVFDADLLKKKKVAVNAVSCAFGRGKCTGLLGHNGAGKTTTIKMIFGLIKPTSGQILFNGNPIGSSMRSKLGYMPETSKLPRNLTCQEIIDLHLSIQKPALNGSQHRELIQQALETVGMWEVRHKKIKALSKGMSRRIAWVQASIHEPELIVLDEPFSGLDPVARYDLLGWIKAFRENGRSLILCTHELWTVRELCDEVHVFKKGSLAYSTSAESQTARSAGFNSAHYQLVVSGVQQDNLDQIRQSSGLKPWEYITQENFLCRLTFSDYETAAAWLSTCLKHGLIVIRFADEISVEETTVKELFSGGILQ